MRSCFLCTSYSLLFYFSIAQSSRFSPKDTWLFPNMPGALSPQGAPSPEDLTAFYPVLQIFAHTSFPGVLSLATQVIQLKSPGPCIPDFFTLFYFFLFFHRNCHIPVYDNFLIHGVHSSVSVYPPENVRQAPLFSAPRPWNSSYLTNIIEELGEQMNEQERI